MNLHDFEIEALEKFTKEITDQFFLFIENDRELFQKYLKVIGRASNLDQTNITFGKRVKDYFSLGNIEDENNKPVECKTPRSKIITSYTEHCSK